MNNKRQLLILSSLYCSLRKIKGIYVLGKPEVSVVAFGSKDFDIYRLADALSKRHWHLNSLQFPSRFVSN